MKDGFDSILYNDKNNHMYRVSKEKGEKLEIYDIHDARDKNIIKKEGNPKGWDDYKYKSETWKGRYMLNIGVGPQANGNGLIVNIPIWSSVMWLRCYNKGYGTFRIRTYDDDDLDYGKFACGFRSLNEI